MTTISNVGSVLPARGATNVNFPCNISTKAPLYAGVWTLNTTQAKTTGGNYTIPPSAMTLNTAIYNNNASLMTGTDTNNFTIKIPDSGTYCFEFTTRMDITLAPTSASGMGAFLLAHTLNGTVLSAPGTFPPVSGLLDVPLSIISNPTANTITYTPRLNPKCTRFFKKGDIISPWYNADSTNFKLVSDGTPSSTFLSVTCTNLMTQ